MKKFLTITLASVLLLAGGSVAYANICAFDPVPAATLLFPFVAYNYTEEADGVNTLFAITNVSAEAQIVHITLWTDYSIPVLDWNVVLTGYDVYTFDIRTILKDGMIMPSYTMKHTTDEGVIDQGPVSHTNPLLDPGGPNWDGPADVLRPDGQPNDSGLAWPESTYVFDNAMNGGCDPDDDAYPGDFADLVIDDTILLFFQQMLQASQIVNDGYNNCAGGADFPLLQTNWWDNRDELDDTWAYITADVVNTCNKAFPDSDEYWNDYAEYDNVLIGDVIWADQNDNYSEVSNAVHIEASEYLYDVTTPGPNLGDAQISFYARYSQTPNTTWDYREPLPTAWAFRYVNFAGDDALGDGSELMTYIRAFKAHTSTSFTVIPDLKATLDALNSQATNLASYNCMAYTYYVWDEEENIDIVPTDDPPYSGGPEVERGVVPNFLPLETQEVNADHFNLVDNAGWLLFVWPWSNYADYKIAGPLFEDDLYYQTWMGVKYVTVRPDGGGYSGAKDGAVMANYNCFEDQRLLFDLGIDFPYVDGGGYVRWTGSSE
jgi:hypothetical protein